MKLCIACVFLLLVGTASAGTTPRPRPAQWAAPVIQSSFDNCYRVSAELYRCEQPAGRDLPDMKALGIRSLLNLRSRHKDSAEFANAGLTLLAEPLEASGVTVERLVVALRKFRDAPKPVLVHCWHGSDRTGAFVAAYRIVFDGWTREAALDEFRNGGFGFHERWFPNLVKLLETVDVEVLKKGVSE